MGCPRNVMICLMGMTSAETKATIHQPMTIDPVTFLVMPRDGMNSESKAFEGYSHINKVINNNNLYLQ